MFTNKQLRSLPSVDPNLELLTLQLLADKLVELHVVDSISDETVRPRLKKTRSSRGCVASG
jgi:hypothetical protein